MDEDNEIEAANTSSCFNYICQFCAKTIRHKSSLLRHILMHENKEYACDQCQKTFKSKIYLSQHVKQKHQESPSEFICQHCGKTFNSKVAIANHVKFKHNDGGRTCNTCDKKFKDNYALQRHLKSHDNTTNPCPKCGKEFKDVKNHVKVCGTKKLPRQYCCDLCDKMFLCKRYLRGHLKNKHRGGNFHPCACGKTFSYKCSLKRHQKICTYEH